MEKPPDPPPRKLIVSADDFGMSPGVNAGILRAYRDGILTNAGLMVSGGACDEAAAMAREHPGLGVGLHLVLAQGRAVLPPRSIPDLVDTEGRFPENPILAGLKYFFHPRARRQLRDEIRAQLERFLGTGLALSHVDGHVNIHMHPAVLPILLDLADELGIRAVRLSRDPLWAALRYDRSHAARKLFEAAAFGALAAIAERSLRPRGIRHPRRVYGLHQTGSITEDYLLRTIADLPPGVSEIYCHAGHADAEARRWRPGDYDGEAEIEALTSPRVREALGRYDVELTSYVALASGEI